MRRYTKQCERCGELFDTAAINARYCVPCRVLVKNQSFDDLHRRKERFFIDRLELIKERWAVLQEQKTIHKIAMGE